MLITSTYAGLKNVEGTFDLVVLDEDQHVTEKSVQNFGISKTLHARTILGMTGTSSTNVKKNKIYSRLGFDNVLYTIDIHKAVKFGLVADYKITVVGVPMSKERVARKVWGKMLPMTEPQYYQYLTGLVNNARPKFYKFCVINRMNFIKNSDSKLQAAKDILSILKGRVLIFAASIAQANRVCAHTFNSKTDDTDLNLFRQKKIDKLALVNSGGTGFTYQDLDHLLLIQVDSDSNGITTQKLTRTLLAQGSSYKANIIILYLKGTKDEDWMPRALARFDISKTEHISLEEFKKKYNEDKSEN
jgi:superfamily II DNA or RNA helicase